MTDRPKILAAKLRVEDALKAARATHASLSTEMARLAQEWNTQLTNAQHHVLQLEGELRAYDSLLAPEPEKPVAL